MDNIDLTKGSLLSHIKQIAIPSGIGLLFNTLFNVVDTYYAGKISTHALAGLTISFPIFFILIAISYGIGSGITALLSISIGEKDFKKMHCFIFNGLILSSIISILIFIFSPSLIHIMFKLSGAKNQTLILGLQYTQTILYGSVFFIANALLNSILNSQGDTKTYRNFLIIGFFINLILDPLFIYGWFNLPKLSTTGIAIATILVQFFGTIYLFYRVMHNSIFDIVLFKNSKFSFKKIYIITKQSLPSSMNMMTIALGVFVINYFILTYSTNNTIAGYGVAMRIEQLALLPTFGLNIAILTITGQNYGAKFFSRIKHLKNYGIIIGTIIMVFSGIIIYIFTPNLVNLFNNDPYVINEAVIYLRIEILAFPTYVIINILLSMLQGIKKPFFAIYIGLYRQIFMPLFCFSILGKSFGSIGIWWSVVFINWTAACITIIYSNIELKKIVKQNLIISQ